VLLHLLLRSIPLGGDLVQTGVEVIGRLDGLNLGLAHSGADAAGLLGVHLGGIGDELRLGLVGLGVGGVQQLQIPVELGEYIGLDLNFNKQNTRYTHSGHSAVEEEGRVGLIAAQL